VGESDERAAAGRSRWKPPDELRREVLRVRGDAAVAEEEKFRRAERLGDRSTARSRAY